MGFNRIHKQFLILLVGVLLASSTFAQTRFYLAQATVSAVSPTVHANWNVTTGNTYNLLIPGKTYALRTANITTTSAQSGATPPRQILLYTFISQPLLSQTINSGSTISMQIKGNCNSAAITMATIVYIRICNELGTSVSEIANMSSTALGNGSATNRTLTVTLGSNVTVNTGDRIVIEIGGNYTVGALTTATVTQNIELVQSVSDLPVDNASTSILNTWIEFSQTISFITTRKINI